ncbi:MAG: hypothetical protein S4CHLAM81_08970 [Chlamydiales bacterium]|nr:hypothetical protein [Chlamydiales bacterium]MCH9635677.1 hypothetical protein [Chlamydiales bacterium]
MKKSILSFNQLPILEQLYIEEALLRADDRNILLINRGSPPAIVMGISGKAEELLYTDRVNIPVIRRFSGGGTVVVDQNTLFVTLICNEEDVAIEPFPKPILQWGADFFAKLIPGLKLKENDFVLGDLKVGGNAQYIRKGRWLLHTSFLVDYDPKLMAMLKMPKKRPQYREDRDHLDFLTKLNIDVDQFVHALEQLGEPLEDLETVLAQEHRRSTKLLNTFQ